MFALGGAVHQHSRPFKCFYAGARRGADRRPSLRADELFRATFRHSALSHAALGRLSARGTTVLTVRAVVLSKVLENTVVFP